jgi:hypothetical protein
LSHITIIIGSKGGSGGSFASGNGQDDIEITYTPPDDMAPKQVGKEVAKRIKWLDTLKHADAGDS